MEYQKCLVELDEILEHLSEEYLRKIPNEIRQAIKYEKDKNYIWEYDETKDLTSQNLDRKTVAMLSYLNMEYLLNEEQKVYMEHLHNLNEKKSEKYNLDDLFKNKTQKQDNFALIEVKENKWYDKIITFLKNIFKKTKK